jgi:hypothetical protein
LTKSDIDEIVQTKKLSWWHDKQELAENAAW